VRALLFSSYFPNPDNPVRGTFNLQQARALARLCEVRAMAPVQWFPVRLWHGAGPTAVPYREEIEGIPTWHPRYVLTPRILRDTYAAQMGAALLPHLARVRQEYPFDVLLATWAFPEVVVGAVAAKLLNVPLIAKVHGSDINVQATFPARRRQIVWALRQAHRILAVSDALRKRMVELGVPAKKIMVHHNGVDQEKFQPRDRAEARRALGIEPGGRHVMFVGYLSESKAAHVLLEAVDLLRTRGELGFTTHFVGCGPLAEAMAQRASAMGLGDCVRFQGRRPHEEIPTWMAAADVFCLPSIREGCPNVILEAFASGRPVAATNVGGIPELASPENSILVPPSDAPALADALQQALAREWDPAKLRAGVANFTWETGARALYEAAQSAVKDHEVKRRLEGRAAEASAGATD